MRSVAILTVVLATALLFLGAVTDAGLATCVAGVAIWGFYVAALRSSGPRGLPISLASAALWGAVGWCLLQLLPLPPGLLRVLSPHSAEIWRSMDRLSGSSPRFHPLSIDPAATMFAGATATVVAMTYQACARYASDRTARLRLVYGVAAAVSVLNLVAIAHRMGGVDRVYGVYVPRYPTSHGLLSPLLNPNHASAVACILPPLLIGVGIGKPLATRLVLAVGVVLGAVVAVLSVSRMGMMVLALEFIVMAAFVFLRGKSQQRLVRLATVSISGMLLLALVVLVSSEAVVAEATKTDVSKIRIPLQGLSLARDYLWFGVGRGAFGSAFPAYEGTLPANARYLYVESWPVQLACDMGIVAAIGYAGAIAYAVYLTRRRSLAEPTYVGAVVALGGLVVHDLLDFAMEFAAAAMLAAVLLAVVTSAGLKRPSSQPARERAVLPAAIAAGIAIAGVLLAISWNRRADDEQLALQERLKGGEPPSTTASVALAAAGRHPADPFFLGLVGSLRGWDPDAGPFLIRSVELGPNRPATHLALARWMAHSGRSAQARAELREAARLDPHLATVALQEMVRMGAELPELLATVDGAPSGDALSTMLMGRNRAEDAIQLDVYLVERFPPAVSARARQIERVRSTDPELAKQRLTELRQAAPEAPETWLLAATFATNDDEAETLLAEGYRRTGKSFNLLDALTRRRAIRLGLESIGPELEEYQIALERAGKPAYLFHAFQAEVEIARNHPSAAIRHYLNAAAAAPESLVFTERAAQLAEQTGQTNMALSLWGRLSNLRPEEPRYRARIQALQSAPTPSSSAPRLLP